MRMLALVVLCGTLASFLPAPTHFGQEPETPRTLEQLTAAADAARATLDVQETEYEARLAVAIVGLTRGQVLTACKELQALDAAGVEGELGARIALERKRADAWSALVESWMTKLVSSGSSLGIEYEGRKLKAKVQAFEAGVAKLAKNKSGVTELSLDSLEPVAVVNALRQKVGDHGQSWLRIYPYALTGDARAHSLLRRDKSEQVSSLKSDAKQAYPELIRTGEAVLSLRELATSDVAKSSDDARAALARIERASTAGASNSMVDARKAELVAVAEHSLTILFEQDGLAGLLVGKVELLDKGRVRITYDFEDERQLDDFVIANDYLSDSRRSRPAMTLPEDVCGVWIEEGDLVTLGCVALKHKLVLRGPQKVSYRLIFKRHGSHATPITNFAMGLCGLEDGSFIWCLDQGHLYMANKRPMWGRMQEIDPRPEVQLGKPYELEVVHDGKEKVKCTSKGFSATEIECGPRTVGFPFLWTHSMAEARLSDLVLEGELDTEILTGMRADWITGRLVELGLAPEKGE